MSDLVLVRDDGEPFVIGDDVEILVSPLSNLPAGQILTQAWFTMKLQRGDADPGVLQKVITATDVPGTGFISDTGAGDGVGALRFDLPRAQTALLQANRGYYWDIQAKTSGDKVVTVRRGTIRFSGQITIAA